MTTLSAPITELPDAFRPLLRTEFEQMVAAGLFDNVPVELVGGVLIEMSPIGPEHMGLLVWLNKRLVGLCGDDYAVSPQNPLAVDDISEPQPDLAILPPGEFRGLADVPSGALLVIEFAKSSLRFDLGEKARRYAMAGYPEYWVIDVEAGIVHVHRGPHDDATWRSVVQQSDGPLVATAAPQITLDAADLFVGTAGAQISRRRL